MNIFEFCLCTAFGFALVIVTWRLTIGSQRKVVDNENPFSPTGYSVEVDCRACGQFNRVPSLRLLDRPKCGRCKARLMPRRRIVLCRVSQMHGALISELDEVWTDEDRLWQRLANHVDGKTKSEAPDPTPTMANR